MTRPAPRTLAQLRIALACVIALSIAACIRYSNPSRVVLAEPGPSASAAPSPRADQPAQKFSASSIQVLQLDPGDVVLPPEFRMAVYEDLIAQLTKTGLFQHVYRSGDRDAAAATDLVILRTKVEGFKQGSERQRAVTTVTGKTSINVKMQVENRDGHVLLDHDLQGKVRFFGGNLRATFDLSKKVTKIVRLNLQTPKA
jgi:hypothetical protein